MDNSTLRYLKSISNETVLTNEEEQMYFKAYEEAKTEEEKSEIREILVRHNLKLVVSIAISYAKKGFNLDDCIQNGNMGLLKAIDRFEYKRGFRFSTYATNWIMQAITRENANTARTIRIPAHAVSEVSKVLKAIEDLSKDEDNSYSIPPAELIAEETGYSVEKVKTLLSYSLSPVSLDMNINDDEDNVTFGDMIEDKSASSEIADRMLEHERHDTILKALDCLTKREREVVIMYHGLDDGTAKTLEEISKKYGLTKERIRQIKAKALRKMQLKYGSELESFL